MLVQRGGRETVGAAVGEWSRSWDCIVADRLQQPASASSEETPVLRLCPPCRGRFTASAIDFVARRATLLPYGSSNSLIYPVEENMPVVARVAARLTLCRDSDRASGARRVLTGEAVNEFATGGWDWTRACKADAAALLVRADTKKLFIWLLLLGTASGW
jgi:hypothetical protein